MYQVRVHGRGGQGVVTAAELLSVAAFGQGRHAQAFPSFGSERTGAPVVAFCRISSQPIRLREPVVDPDAVIVQDATLLHQVDLFGGLRQGGTILVNSARSPGELGLGEIAERLQLKGLVTLPATELALTYVGRPVPNAALLGGFAALTGEVSLSAVLGAIRDRFPDATGDRNVAAATAAYETINSGREEPGHAKAG
jgi:pyruvate ferredoxin oxidoreductase gamma subunit